MESLKPEDSQTKWLRHFIIVESCIIAEIHRLAEEMPVDFAKPQTSRFAKLLLDFSYFEKRLVFDEYVSSNEEGRNLDEEFYGQFTGYLNQFTRLLDALFGLLTDYTEYADKSVVNFNLLDRRYVKLNALKCETLYLLGVALLLIEEKFPGLIKERVFVALYRTSMNFATRKFELLVSIMRNRKENFESCFQHIQINDAYVEQMVNFLRYYATQQPESIETVDNFTQERLMAMIYVCLFFKSDILHNQFSVMRQIVDKYFQSDYIIPIHLELAVNLSQKWEPYKAATSTLQSTVDSTNVSRKFFEVHQRFQQLSFPAGSLLVENLGDYAELVGEYNDCLRWLVLHSSEVKVTKKTSYFNSSTTTAPVTSLELFHAVVKVSQFAHKLKQSCLYIIAHKIDNANRLKGRICNIFDQIVLLINNQMFQDCAWNDKLSEWIKLIQEQIQKVDPNDPETPQVIEHFEAKINEVAELQQQFAMVILQQYFSLVLADLGRLKNICLVQQSFVTRLEQRTDSMYLWKMLKDWMSHFEELLKNDALAVKFVFLKLTDSISNVLSTAFKIDQPKMDVIANYYNKKLEKRLRKIIQVIPHAIFEQLESLQNLLPTSRLVQVEKTHIKQWAELERRRLLAQKVFEVTKLSLGISNMCISRLGSVEISPKKLLLDGFRNELHIKLSALLETDLPANTNIIKFLNAQILKMNSFRDAFLFVCEHLGINGVQLWQQQVQEIMTAGLEVEKNNLKHKTIVKAQPNGKKTVIGIVMDTFMLMTNPRTTYYIKMADQWASSADLRKLTFTSEVFNVLEELAPGVTNIGVRTLIDTHLYTHVQSFIHECKQSVHLFNQRGLNARILSSLNTSAEFMVIYKRLLEIVMKIGQLQILKQNLDVCVRNNLNVRVHELFNASNTLHKALVLDRETMNYDMSQLSDLKYFVTMIEKLVSRDKITIDESNQIASCACLLIFIFCCTYLKTTANSTKKSEFIDPFTVVSGILFLLHKFNLTNQFTTLNELHLNGSVTYPHQKAFKSARSILTMNKIPGNFK